MQTVCLIGKPNVGKSSIFNRLSKEKKAIILDTPGVTRDRIYSNVTYKDKSFHLIDTGGIANGVNFDKEILMQAELAIDEADVILFVVDGMMALDSDDRLVQGILHKTNKKVIVVVNKLDNDQRADNVYEYYSLGFSNVIGVSAEHNIGFDNLLNEIVKGMNEETVIDDNTIKFCLVGRPNVGKSSLVNSILGKEQVIVSNVAGTTRDAIDTKFRYNGEEYTIIDTAGLRKKGKIYEDIEKYAFMRSMKAIDRSDVCVLVIDAEEGIIEHDKHIASYILDAGKALVIAINKWDTTNNPNEDIAKWKQKMEYEFQFTPFAKIVFLSAKTKKGVGNLMPEVIAAYQNNTKDIPTNLLNDVVNEAVSMHIPPSYKGKRLKIYFVHQTGYAPPKFTFEVNNKRLVHFSYERYLENEIRKSFDLDGTPIVLQFKNKND